jgi:alpha-tubulin suppressor-like RCC1 family protein
MDGDSPDGSDGGPALVSLAIAPDSVSLAAGFTAQLTAEATYSDQSRRDVTAVSIWSVTDPAIAEIDPTGLLRTRAPGATIANATFDGEIASAAISVSPAIVVQVDTWNKHNLVVKSDGALIGWGWNQHRQLDPIAEDQLTTPTVLAIEEVAWARACGVMTLAVKRDGTVWSWGANDAGQLGNGNVGPAFVADPAPVLGVGGSGTLSGVRDLSCGYNFVLALMPDGTVLSWGGNTFGSLGLGGASNPINPIPTRIDALANVDAIAAGTYHGVALLDDGTLRAWGYNDYGQLGSGDFAVHTNSPAPVVGVGGAGQLANVVQLDAGWGHTLAVTGDGRALAWGWDAYGQLGDMVVGDRIAPAPVLAQGGAELADVVRVSAGFTHSLALLGDGTLVSWGNNMFGALGDGALEDRDFAAPVLSTAGPLFMGTDLFAGGGDHGIVLTLADEVYVWGSNASGELGNGTFGMVFVRTPVLVGGL